MEHQFRPNEWLLATKVNEHHKDRNPNTMGFLNLPVRVMRRLPTQDNKPPRYEVLIRFVMFEDELRRKED